MKEITSPTNPTVKLIKKLKDKKYRDLENAYIIEGNNIIEDAVRNDEEIAAVVINAVSDKEYEFTDAQSTLRVSPQIFLTLTDTVTPQDVIAIVIKRKRRWTEGKKRLIILDGIQDPGNAGTIIRTAEAAGFKEIIALKGTVDVYSPKVVRAAAGSLFRIGIRQAVSRESVLEELTEKKINIYACDSEGEQEYTEAKLEDNIAIVVGNEGNGISDFFLENVHTLKIPMKKDAESLNAAVAAAVVIYESVRQGGI